MNMRGRVRWSGRTVRGLAARWWSLRWSLWWSWVPLLSMSAVAAAVEPGWVAVPALAAQSAAATAHASAAKADGAAAEATPTPLVLRGWWSPAAAGPDPRPVVLMLHGCGGMLGKNDQPSARMDEYMHLLNAQGWHALALDSLTPRGETSLCTQRIGTRKVTQTQRRQDVWAALRWLAGQPQVDATRTALLGWSNGGSAVLAATNLRHPAVRALQQAAGAPPRPRLAVAFYPGCEADLQRGYQPMAPLVLMLGLADDWTPAQPCLDLAQGSADITVHAWEGAYHGFDGTAPFRLRADVPNGAHPGAGVHVGGHAKARQASVALLVQSLTHAFDPVGGRVP